MPEALLCISVKISAIVAILIYKDVIWPYTDAKVWDTAVMVNLLHEILLCVGAEGHNLRAGVNCVNEILRYTAVNDRCGGAAVDDMEEVC
ncbi:Uncharacterised protein [Sphingobacterium thalpophilum]|uniref:Uncharacterized protein n=1 Tax=Sphingobacterium thalpophilum TaxID=259 RepID=A0A4U9UKL7_9SPHI|nr:Uncharacterised protein [Sphingobacterium thalpophilum]